MTEHEYYLRLYKIAATIKDIPQDDQMLDIGGYEVERINPQFRPQVPTQFDILVKFAEDNYVRPFAVESTFRRAFNALYKQSINKPLHRISPWDDELVVNHIRLLEQDLKESLRDLPKRCCACGAILTNPTEKSH
ncbi:MAG: hypothetical protein HQK96_18725 [Nitrospirae bacterium]|nr:hypothetical protein [Nitrospirota bacterium]